jgi:putative spermidine/putrescine transport system substrate-binding protein
MEEKPEEVEEEQPTEGVSRRKFLTYLALGAGVAAIAGVGGYAGYSLLSQAPRRAPLQWWGVGTGDPEQQVWHGLGDEVIFSTAPWDPVFTLDRMRTGGRNTYDVISNAGTLDDPLAEDGSIVAFEPEEELASWGKIYPELRENNPTITVESTGEIVGVPIVQNGDSVAMLVDEIWPGETQPGQGGDTYGLLFDDQFANRTAMESSWACAIYKVGNYLARNSLATLDDLETYTSDDLAKIRDFMLAEKAANQFRTFWTGWETAVGLLTTRDVIAMDTWEPVVFELKRDGINAYYMDPKEGFYLWNIPIYLTPRGNTVTRDRCLNLMEWTLQGWYGARITTIRGYLTATPDAITYARDNPDAPGGPYREGFVRERHEKVKGKFADAVSVYGNQSPPNINEYQETWTRVTA